MTAILAGYSVAEIHAAWHSVPGWLGILDRAGMRLSRIEALDAYADRMAEFEREQEAQYWAWWREDGRKQLAAFIASEQPEPLNSGRVTDEQIFAARQVPIASLMDVDKRGYAECPFTKHKRGRRFSTKNGIGFCFDCREKPLDAIGYLMKFRGMKFAAAVQELAR